MLRVSPFRSRHKILIAPAIKSEGEPCKQGETASQSGCVPASGEGHKKPTEGKEETVKIDEAKVGEPTRKPLAKWTFNDGHFDYEQTVHLESANYQGSKVHRWVSVEDETGAVTDEGEWTTNEQQASDAAQEFVESKQQPEEETRVDWVRPPNKDLPKQSRPHLRSLEIDALEHYTSGGFETLNNSLRKAGDLELSEEDREVDRILQKLFAKVQPFTTPVKVYRGANLLPKHLEEFLDSLKEAQSSGGPLQFSQYLSTSTNLDTANDHGGNVLFEIEAMQGIDAEPYTKVPSEDELLLNRDQKFEVVSVDEVSGQHVVKLRHVITR